MRDDEVIRRLGGQERVSFTLSEDPSRVAAIAHEYGYVLTEYHMSAKPIRIRMNFVRDGREEARLRAAWADYHYRTNGAWWAACWPTPTGIPPRKAAAYRIAVHQQREAPLTQPLTAYGILLTLAVAGAVPLAGVSTPLAALLLVGVAGLGGWGVAWAHRRAKNALPRHLAKLEQFERQRVYASPGQPGGP
ncbi:hypothetical protein FH609_006980 [Streptomyces sp. 3MP-14]|uniref:Uncharacterized protein n=1 Tax=Streptomyces mimosae TaxID=2586635 RepID=A0A5N6ALA8_9ACTN|nr:MULTISPECIES: hypothetical protein [Streptomyces]KAB8168843.1 hypothetical protein FH607_006385 [Streptomyces mimosae]KAB8177877.1 hypothetical protein FH609_006980 [Streptomyces sp. 3MP-14]